MFNWYALHSKPNSERIIQEQLKQKGLEVYLPMWQPPARSRWTPAPRAFFPCYLFVKADLDAVGRSALEYMPGVRDLVWCAGVPAVVPDAVIERIRERLTQMTSGVLDSTGLPLHHGDRVRITGGPLNGFDAVFDCRLSDQDRVRVLVNFIQSGAHVEVDREWVEKKNDSAFARAHVKRR